jgi:hypothetical protein
MQGSQLQQHIESLCSKGGECLPSECLLVTLIKLVRKLVFVAIFCHYFGSLILVIEASQVHLPATNNRVP